MYLDNGGNTSFATLIQTSSLASLSTDGNTHCALSSKRDKRVVRVKNIFRRILRLLGGRLVRVRARVCKIHVTQTKEFQWLALQERARLSHLFDRLDVLVARISPGSKGAL